MLKLRIGPRECDPSTGGGEGLVSQLGKGSDSARPGGRGGGGGGGSEWHPTIFIDVLYLVQTAPHTKNFF